MALSTGEKVGLGALIAGILYYVFKPADAGATNVPAETSLDPVQPAPPAQESNPPAAGYATFNDPATGVVIIGPSTAIMGGSNYTVRSGESWSNIAARTYGDYRWWPFLWDRNRSPSVHILPEDLRVGESIFLPAAVIMDAAYRDAIYARAVRHRAWWLAKVQGRNPGPMGDDILKATPLPEGSLLADGAGGVSPDVGGGQSSADAPQSVAGLAMTRALRRSYY